MYKINETVSFKTATLVWNSIPARANNCDLVIVWDEYAPNDVPVSVISLPTELEQNADIIRSQILSFIYKTGNKKISGKTIIESLVIRESFSWWWMTLFSLRRWHENSNLYNLARIYALRISLIEFSIEELEIVDFPRELKEPICSLCEFLSIKVVSKSSNTHPAHKYSATQIKNQLPTVVRAAATLFKDIYSGVTFRKQRQFSESDGFCFFDYFVGLSESSATNGPHNSRYWGPLASLPQFHESPTGWFHIVSPDSGGLTFREAESAINENYGSPRSNHFILASKITIRIVGKSLRIYAKGMWFSLKQRRILSIFLDSDTGIDSRALFNREWLDSLRGGSAMHHAILFCSIEDQMRKLPPQKAAFFVMENQPWEMALICAWKRFQTNPIIGIPHAAAKFWELRHFVDPRSRSAHAIHKFPEPDVIGVNSPFMRKLLENNSFPPERIIDLEAAGFTHLYKSPSIRISSHNSLPKSTLIFGDYDRDLTMRLLETTARSLGELDSQTTNIFRPHPMCVVIPEILSKHGFLTNEGSISDQLEVADLVIAPSSTSAAVEAFCLGIPVVILLGAATFNFSPLRNMDGAFFASDEKGLGLAIASAASVGRTNPRPYFYIDPVFTRWRSLLDELR